MLKYFLTFVLDFLKKLFSICQKIISYVPNNNFSYTQLSFVFLLQIDSCLDHDDTNPFSLFFFRKIFISLKPFFAFFLFLLHKDFGTFHVLFFNFSFFCFFFWITFINYFYICIQKNINIFLIVCY